MPALHYLTVQDLLWINHRVTGKVNSFRYDLLEEATFYQYGYGASLDLEAQARKFFSDFPAKEPFTEGNKATALIGCLAFLEANGKRGKVTQKAGDVTELTIEEGIHIHGTPDIRGIIEKVIRENSSAIAVPEVATS